MQMPTKGNVVLYLDKELVEKSKELGFNLSKTFENHLKQLINGNTPVLQQNNGYSESNKSKWWAEPDSDRRPSARQADVLTRLDDRPTLFAHFTIASSYICTSFQGTALCQRNPAKKYLLPVSVGM